MSHGTTEPPALPVAPLRPRAEHDERLGRLGPLLFQAHLGWSITFASVSAILLPAFIQEIAPADKVTLFGLLTLVSAFAGIFANIIFGALSDRTRTRWGRRNPWILVGGVFSAACLSSVSFVDSYLAAVLLSVGFTVGFNAVIGSLYAVLPDRVAPSRRGTASAIIGFVSVVSQSFGAIIAAAFLSDVRLGIGILPWLFGVTSIVFFVFAKDKSVAPTLPPFEIKAFLRGFKPPLTRDFTLALVGRLLLNLAYNAVIFYQLYALQDYLKLGVGAVAATVAIAGTCTAVGGGLGAIIAGPISDRIGRRKPLFLVSAGLMALVLIPLIVAPSVATFLLFTALGGFAYGTYQSIDQALMAAVLPSTSDHGKDLGFLNIAHTLPVFLTPAVAAAVLGAGLGYPGLYTLCIVFALVAGVLVFSIKSLR